MARYVERDNEAVYPQPYALNRSTAYAFVVGCERERLQALVDRTLNAPRGDDSARLSYRVLSRHALLTFTAIERLFSSDPPYDARGYGVETDVAYWLLLGAGHERDGVFALERLLWMQPYIFVDNPWALLGGREVYGFPKQYCRAPMPASPQQASAFAAQTLVLDPFSADSELSWRTLIEVERGGAAAAASPWSLAELERLLHGLLASERAPVVPTFDLVTNLLSQLRQRRSGLVFLKQFRDVAEPSAACYQAVIEAPLTVTAVHGFGLLPGPWRIRPYDYASQPLARSLGLPDQVEAAFGFWLGFDSTIGRGEAVWTASG